MTGGERSIDGRAGLVLVILTALVIAPQLGSGLVLYDVGEVFYFADAIGRGLRPGIDYTVNAYGPGRYLLMAGIFSATGPSLAAWGAVLLASRLGITALAWAVGRRFLPPRWALLPVLCLLIAPGPLHKGFYLLGTLALVWALLRYLERPGRRQAGVFGLILVAVACFRLDLGAFGGLAMLLVGGSRRDRWRDGVVAFAPLGWGLLLSGLALAAVGSLGPVLAQMADDVLKNQRIHHPSFPGPGRLLSGDVDAVFLWLPVAVYAALATHFLWTVRREGDVVPIDERRRVALLLLLGGLTCNQVRMKPEFGHLLQAGPLLWLACALLLERLGRRGRGRQAASMALALALVGGLAGHTLGKHRGSVYTGSFTIRGERDQVLDTRLGAVRLNPGEFAELEPTLRWLDAQPPGPLWVPTNQPLLLALSGRRDVTGRVGVVYYADSRAAQRDVIDRLETHRPALAVFVDDTIEGPERMLGVAAPRVHSYLLTNYVDVERHGRFRLMRRSPSAQ